MGVVGSGDAVAPSDGAVVRAVLEGDTEVYAILVDRYKDELYRHAERMTRSADVAADIVQTAFITGYEKLSSCRDPERVGGWLFRIVANRCRDYLKNRRRRNVTLDDAIGLESPGGDPESRVERGDVRARIDAALARLPDDQREAFVLKHVEGLSYGEMQDRLGASISALKMRVHRARDELQALLEEYR